MNKRILSTAAGLLLIGVVGVGLGVWNHHTGTTQNGHVQSAAVTPTPIPSPSTVTYAGVAGKTALDLLKMKDPGAVVTGSGTNAYVTAINGYTASSAKKEYWAMYVNGALANVGAGSYVTKSGDQIQWKIASY